MKPINIFAFCLFIFTSFSAKASMDFSVGISSVTSGRAIPAASMALNGSTWAMSFMSVGTKSSYSYYSGYMLGVYKHWLKGQFWGGEFIADFGGGVYYYQLGLKDTGAAIEEASDVALGPSFRLHWRPVGPLFVNLEALYGIRDLANNITLSYQDVVLLSMGFRL